VKYSDLPSATGSVPHSEELPVPKPTENLTLAMTHLILMKIMDMREGVNVDFDPTCEESCSPCEQHLLTHRDLNDLVRDLNFSKKTS
jgi:hypothetical protein